MRPPGVHWLGWGAAAAMMGLLLSHLRLVNLPTGADPGRTWYLGRLLLAGRLAEVDYTPLLPALIGLLWKATGDAFLAWYTWTPAVLLIAVTACAACLGQQVGRSRAAAAAAAVTAANPVVWFTLHWGGYAQVAAWALVLAAAALYARALRTRRVAWPAIAFVGAWAANPYPPLFASVALAVWLVLRPTSRLERRDAVRGLVIVAAGALLLAPFYWNVAGAITTGMPAPTFGTGLLAWAPIGQVFAQADIVLPGLGLAALGIAALPREWRAWQVALVAAGLGVACFAALTQWLTFTNLTGRAVQSLAVFGPVLGAAMMARIRTWTPVAAAIAAMLLAPGLVAQASAARDYYGRLSQNDLAIASVMPEGGVAVLGQDAMAAGFWLEGARLEPSLNERQAWRYLGPDKLHEVQAVSLWRSGQAVVGQGPWFAVAGGCLGSGLHILHDTGFSLTEVLRVDDSSFTVNGAPIWPVWDLTTQGSSLVQRHSIEGGTLELRVEPIDGAVAITMTADVPVGFRVDSGADAVISDGGTFVKTMPRHGELPRSEALRWTGTPSLVDRALVWPLTHEASVKLLVDLDGEARTTLERLREHGVTTIALRAPSTAELHRAEADAGLARVASAPPWSLYALASNQEPECKPINALPHPERDEE